MTYYCEIILKLSSCNVLDNNGTVVYYGKIKQDTIESYISLAVTAIRARTISKGYVSMVAVMPAREPASKRGKGGSALKQPMQLMSGTE